MTQPSQPSSGILLVDKPEGLTSAEVLNRLKRRHKFDRIGHGGTLDPFATGLLVVLVGEGTKIARFLLEGEKSYEAEATLGVETDTGDLTGQAVKTEPLPAKSFSLQDWQRAAEKFTGRIRQTPPAYSAVKVKGKALYEYARKGETVEVKAREVVIRELQITKAEEHCFQFQAVCSGGTYIRVLASDLARSLGLPAHLRTLRRTGSSSFRVSQALSLEACLEAAPGSLPLLSLEQGLSHLPRVECGSSQAEKVRQGNLAVFESMRTLIEKPGYFLLLESGKPVAICNHHPMLVPFCSIERVFDPRSLGT